MKMKARVSLVVTDPEPKSLTQPEIQPELQLETEEKENKVMEEKLFIITFVPTESEESQYQNRTLILQCYGQGTTMVVSNGFF